MKKKIISAVLACLLGISMIGCSTPKEDETKAASDETKITDADTQNENTQDEVANSETDPCTITFLSWYPQESYQPILDAFAEEYPDIKVEFQYAAPVSDYLEKMQVLTSTGEVPDVFYIAAENKTEMIQNGYCADLTDTQAISKLVEENKKTYEANGKIYGFAPTTWVGGYFYNTEIFKELNLEEPTTWDEFLSICKVLTENDTRAVIERGEWFWNSFLGPFMNDYMADNPDYHKEVLEGTKTFADGWGPYIEKWYNDMIVTGYIDEDLVSVSSQEFFSEFATGNAAMLAGHAGHLLEVEKLDPEFEIGFFPMPGTEADINVVYGAVDCAIAINSETEYKQQAEIFLDFIARDDIVQLYQEMNGYVIGMDGIETNVNPILSDIAREYSNGNIAVYIPQGDWDSYGTALQRELVSSSQQLLLQEIDSDTFISQMQSKLEELLEN